MPDGIILVGHNPAVCQLPHSVSLGRGEMKEKETKQSLFSSSGPEQQQFQKPMSLNNMICLWRKCLIIMPGCFCVHKSV